MSGKIVGNEGFTFLEMMAVMAILLATLAAGTVAMTRLSALGRVSSSSDEVRSLLVLARELSVGGQEGKSYKVVSGGGVVTVNSQTGEEWRRYQLGKGVAIVPSSFELEFVPVTGEAVGCDLGCQLVISSVDVEEVIKISRQGVIK